MTKKDKNERKEKPVVVFFDVRKSVFRDIPCNIGIAVQLSFGDDR